MNTTDTKATTISRVANVIIPVGDQDRMLEFYTETLGLEKRADVPFGAETPIALAPPGPSGKAGGKDTGITLQTDDIASFHAQLRDRDVDVDAEVSHMGDPVPPLFWLRDPEANILMVVEVR